MLDQLYNLGEPMRQIQGNIDPLITSLVVGAPTKRQFPSQLILRNIEVPTWTFSYTKYGFEKFQNYDTERAMRAEIRTSDVEVSTATGKLRRFTHALKRDEDELANAAPSLRIRELLAATARFIVTNSIENIIQTLLTTTTNYPSTHRLAISGGSEWDSGSGNSRANIRSMASKITADTGVSYSDISVFLTDASFQAALGDTNLLTHFQYTQGGSIGVAELAAYWGVKEVLVGNPITYSAAGVVSPLYGDVAILFVRNVDGAEWDTEYGEFDFAVNFKWNKGTALEAWYERRETCWWFPWQDYANPQIINSNLGAIITNCAA